MPALSNLVLWHGDDFGFAVLGGFVVAVVQGFGDVKLAGGVIAEFEGCVGTFCQVLLKVGPEGMLC